MAERTSNNNFADHGTFGFKQEIGISHKKIDLKTCAFVSSSMLTGLLRLVILMPEDGYVPPQQEQIPQETPVQNEDVSQYIPPQDEAETTPPTNASITLEQAIEIAYADLAVRGISADFRTDSGVEWEYGQWVWELEFRGSMGIIEFYINANTGAIVKFEIDGW